MSPNPASAILGPVFATPLLSYGFRVFFLFAGLQAALSMAAWLLWIGLHAASIHVLSPSIALPSHLWHAHEMLFGYSLAVIAGFLLTAVPGWTGQRRVQGGLLAALAGLWLAARLASWTTALLPAPVFAVFELGFIALLIVLIARALLTGWSPRNLVFLPVLLAIFAAAALTHAEMMGLADGTLAIGQRLVLNAVLLLITVIGGRIVPAFTTNALRQIDPDRLPVSHKPLEIAAIASMALLLLSDLVAPGSAASGAIALAACLAGGLRMVGWCSLRTLHNPLLWILHLGYAWLVLGLALKGLALVTGSILEITALHALTVGAIGSMTLGVMTRAGLGHTGRALVAPRAIVWAYVLISLAALVRIIGPLVLPAFYNQAMLLAGVAWALAFALFSWVYLPILTRPRRTARPSDVS